MPIQDCPVRAGVLALAHAHLLRFLPRSSPTTAQGFKHFSLHLRGREELLVTVHHRDSLVAGDAPDARFDRAPSVSDFLPSPSLRVRGFGG